jgi:signal transduction histidine kinase
MNDKKLLFPLLLFGIFFVLITITGFFQITIIKRNIEGLLRGEGETLFRSVSREIEVSMEYLNLVEKSPSIITPNILNVMTYDEAIVDDIVNQLAGSSESGPGSIPLNNLLVANRNGKQIERRGNIRVSKADIELLLKGEQQTIVRMPSDADHSLFMGIKLPQKIVFFSIAQTELENLRKIYVMRTIIENERKRLSIAEINIYDRTGKLYLGSTQRPKEVFSISKPLSSDYFPGFSMEILVSNRLAIDTFRRTSGSFIILLFFLMLGGAGGISLIFRLDRRHAASLKEIEKDMAMKERLVSLGKLASGMAHEIRNPLNAIGISIQRLKREFIPEEAEKREEYQKFLDIVRGEVIRVNRIVEEFLLSTKSGMPMERQNLFSIVEEVVMMLREKAHGAGVRIANDSDRELFLECQRERLKQVFYNLITNSIEAMGAGGTIEISSETEGPNVNIIVRDTGPGIKKDDLLKIFEYYYTTKDKGMGLGLPISYMIVKDHGGDMKVLSDEGKGTLFVITLPTRRGS